MTPNITNGASLEDCHANFFSLTDVCGIKWLVFREGETSNSGNGCDDAVLRSYRSCLESDILSVWRRVPKTSLVTYSYDQLSGNQIQNPSPKNEETGLWKQRKELWIFWYGDRPTDVLKKLVDPQLTEIADISGTWENGLPYEARTLLYKALNNLIERSLVKQDFVRLGKWFVQPYDGPDRPLSKSSHLSFSFQYFVHGESSVCASVDVRQHPPVRRLSCHHLNLARGGQASPVHIILAPYGLSGTLTGITYRSADGGNISQLLKEWHHFYPLNRNKYYSLDNSGELVTMPPAVEVMVAGVKLIYPTCYVLVTDIDNHRYESANKTMHTFRSSEDAVVSMSDFLPYEPSAFAANNHHLLQCSDSLSSSRIEQVWSDSYCPFPKEDSVNNSLTDLLSLWDFTHPGRIVKKKLRSSRSKERDKSLKNKFSKVPFHKRNESLEELNWLDNFGSNSVVRHLKDSPSKRTPSSPVVVLSNGPLTPLDSEMKPPSNLPIYSGVGSPFTTKTLTSHHDVPATTLSTSSTTTTMSSSSLTTCSSSITAATSQLLPPSTANTDNYNSNQTVFGNHKKNSTLDIFVPSSFKRPILPTKEYEEELEREDKFSDTIYDYHLLTAWLNHPVKKFKPNDSRSTEGDPLRPMYRRNSQAGLFSESIVEPILGHQDKSESGFEEGGVHSSIHDLEVTESGIGGVSSVSGSGDPYEFSDDKNKSANEEDKKDWLTSDGLKPSMNDLDNLFDLDDSSDEPSGVNPTPPNSNKPEDDVLTTKLPKLSKIDPTGNLPHDQLAKMFPTPPSHEHNPIASPVENETPLSPWVQPNETSDEDSDVINSKFGPLSKLYSDDLPPLILPPHCIYKRSAVRSFRDSNAVIGSLHKTLGMSSPSSLEGPRSNFAGSPASAVSSKDFHKKSSGAKLVDLVADSLILNLVLSETLLNLFRDHNFDSCTMCVCSNEGNIKGRDAPLYLNSDFAGDDDVRCTCGYSAVVNRRLSHQSGLFYEDESEVTSINEDLYDRKKPSLLLNTTNTHFNSTTGSLVDVVPMSVIELLTEQLTLFPSMSANTLVKCSTTYLNTPSSISMVELMDHNEVVFTALSQVKDDVSGGKLDEALKGACIHKWTLLPAEGPFCSEDIIRVMKSLQPLLNETLHSRTGKNLSVEGPLTWRQFHRMAGPSTKGNTDDECEPLPIPFVTVGYENDFVSISPLALGFWDVLGLQPFGLPRDIAYIVLAPDNDFLLSSTKTFFKNLSSIYELCRLGKHVPITKVLRDGVLKVNRSAASKLSNQETEEWFELIGDSPTASLLKLYAQVCRHYLLPVLNQITFDKSLLETEKKTSSVPPPLPEKHSLSSPLTSSSSSSLGFQESNLNIRSEEGESKDNLLDSPYEDELSDPPAIVIYMIDPFNNSEHTNHRRLSSLGLLRCFSQMIPHFNETLKANVYLQVVSLENILDLVQSQSQTRLTKQLKGMAFSVYTQAQKPLQYQKECKMLTGLGPASTSEKYLKSTASSSLRYLRCPTFVLAPPPVRKKSSESESFGSSSTERSSVLFVNYCLSEDQHWLLASCSDDRGELLKTVVINIEIPNKTRRKKASARRVGLRKLMDWILGVMSLNLCSWRLVIGRIGRIGHGELRGWSVLLSRKALKKASKQLREMCSWTSDVPTILSACLVSMEPDSSLRLMTDQFTPDERFGQTASNCQLSTPKDVSATHILVFPTSATAQSSQEAFRDHQIEGATANDLELGIEIGDIEHGDDGGMEIGDLNDIFDDNWTGGGVNIGSPGSPKGGKSSSRPSSPHLGGNGMQCGISASDEVAFRYGQEESGERIEILQQPLALGYLVSTAKTGMMPRWFWASCPHLENNCPVFLKSALHINVASVLHGGDDGFNAPQTSGRVHSLDSTYTTDVLRYVLEGYNALSWLSLDSVNHDRVSCLPIHVQVLSQMYGGLASLV